MPDVVVITRIPFLRVEQLKAQATQQSERIEYLKARGEGLENRNTELERLLASATVAAGLQEQFVVDVMKRLVDVGKRQLETTTASSTPEGN